MTPSVTADLVTLAVELAHQAMPRTPQAREAFARLSQGIATPAPEPPAQGEWTDADVRECAARIYCAYWSGKGVELARADFERIGDRQYVWFQQARAALTFAAERTASLGVENERLKARCAADDKADAEYLSYTNDTLNQRNRALFAAHDRIRELESDNRRLEQERDEATEEITHLRRSNSSHESNIRDLRRRLSTACDEAEGLQRRLAAQETSALVTDDDLEAMETALKTAWQRRESVAPEMRLFLYMAVQAYRVAAARCPGQLPAGLVERARDVAGRLPKPHVMEQYATVGAFLPAGDPRRAAMRDATELVREIAALRP